jgi:predicted nuclease of predicted toxin-antitoxin system
MATTTVSSKFQVVLPKGVRQPGEGPALQADCLMLASARAFGALLITQDSDFQGIEGVRWLPKPSQSASYDLGLGAGEAWRRKPRNSCH